MKTFSAPQLDGAQDDHFAEDHAADQEENVSNGVTTEYIDKGSRKEAKRERRKERRENATALSNGKLGESQSLSLLRLANTVANSSRRDSNATRATKVSPAQNGASISSGEERPLKRRKSDEKASHANSHYATINHSGAVARRHGHGESKSGKNSGGGQETGQLSPPQTRPHAYDISEPAGGRMANVDPVFSQDEQYIMLAFDYFVGVYVVATSLQVCKLPLAHGKVTAVALNPHDPSELCVSSDAGYLGIWNWLDGVQLRRSYVKGSLHSITLVNQADDAIVYGVHQAGHDKFNLVTWEKASTVSRKCFPGTLTSQSRPIAQISILNNAGVIILFSGHDLTIGLRTRNAAESSLAHYSWRTIKTPEWIVCCDVKIRDDEWRRPDHIKVDVALGCLKGSIHVYEDLVGRLLASEKAAQKGSSDPLTSRQLHWHRNAVNAVRWSRDGNYIISGGNETVLVLWQMDNGQKTTLPHLGAPIENITLSANGASYAIRLADNTTMVVSTADFKPLFNFAALQAPMCRSPLPTLPSVPNIDHFKAGRTYFMPAQIVCTANPHRPNDLLCAVPSQGHSPHSQSGALAAHSSPFLQTVDLQSGSQISRQALTRTKVTDLNAGPDSNTIREPNVTFLCISHDGRSLVSVDEWTPPSSSLEHLSAEEEHEKEEAMFRQEVYLKFWSWSDDDETWQMVSRIDDPHAPASGEQYASRRILGVAAHPHRTAFAILGEEGVVKTWQTVPRRRNGLDVKGEHGQVLKTWQCQLSASVDARPTNSNQAYLTYSEDGSMIAIGYDNGTSAITIQDSMSGSIKTIQSGLVTSSLFGLGCTGKFLIILSHHLVVWDLVENKCISALDLTLPPDWSAQKLRLFTHLTCDVKEQTYAVVIPRLSSRHHIPPSAHLAVFSPMRPIALHTTKLSDLATALVTAPGGKAYHVIDDAARIRTVSRSTFSNTISNRISSKIPTICFPTRPQGISALLGPGEIVTSESQPSAQDSRRTHLDQVAPSETDEREKINLEYFSEKSVITPSNELPSGSEMFTDFPQTLLGNKRGGIAAAVAAS